MNKYRTIQTLDLFSGEIGLTDNQAEPRKAKLELIKKRKGISLYRIIGHVQFKAGEVIQLGEMDKVTIPKLEDLEKPEKPDPEKTNESKPGETSELGADNNQTLNNDPANTNGE